MEQHISGRRMIIRLFIMKRGDMRTRNNNNRERERFIIIIITLLLIIIITKKTPPPVFEERKKALDILQADFRRNRRLSGGTVYLC